MAISGCMITSADTFYPAHLQYVISALQSAMTQAGLDGLVIEAGRVRLAFQDDQAYPFRPNPWYLWPAPAPAAPGSLFLIRNNELPELLLVLPQDYWHIPPQLPTASWTRHIHVVPLPTAAAALQRAMAFQGRTGWLGESPSPRADWPANPPRLIAQLELARSCKTAYELACLRRASTYGACGHVAAERAFREGRSEFDIHLAFLAATRQNETDLPYGNIVGLNEHAATLHYQLRDTAPPAQHRSLLIDAGATAAGYASDITRTWAAAPGDFADLIDGMERLQQQLCGEVRSGVDWRELHLRAHYLVAELLKDAAVLETSAAEAVALGISSAFLPHGLGHLLGLQVHDVGGFRSQADGEPIPRPAGHPALRLTRCLAPGMVVTVEPGVYFIDSLLEALRAGPHARQVNWALIDALRPFGGIRIEDNVAVGEGASENLTRAAFAGLTAG
jgi:Xaa-Pro dipeptidase